MSDELVRQFRARSRQSAFRLSIDRSDRPADQARHDQALAAARDAYDDAGLTEHDTDTVWRVTAAISRIKTVTGLPWSASVGALCTYLIDLEETP